MKIVGAQVGEVVDDGQKVMLNDVPTRFEEGPCEAVRSRSFMAMSPMYGIFHFVLGEWVSNVGEVTSWDWDVSPIEIRGPQGCLFGHVLKVLMNESLLLVLLRDPTVSILEPVDEIFPSTPIDA
jgi:hypothetical protein